ncbi:MAG: cation:proton antiporter, partial [Acidobacteria bacterium]
MSHLLQLLALLSLMVAGAKLAGAAAVRVGQPAVFGEILIGLLLGPTFVNVLEWPVFVPAAVPHLAGVAPAPLMAVVQDLADVGVILLMFVAGLETDVDEMRRTGHVAFWSAAGGVVLPMAGGIATAAAFGMPIFWEAIFVGTILTATSVSISAQTLMELGVLRSKEGSTILGAAVIDDVMGLVVLSIVVAFAQASEPGVVQILAIVLRMAAFFVAALLVGRHFERIAAWGDRLGVSQGLLATVTVIAFVYAWAAEYVGGVAAITGSYVAGVLLTQTSFKKRIDAGVHPLTYSVLVPIFFISIGLRANGRDLGAHTAFTIALVLVAIGAKAIGCGALAKICGFSPRESLRVGVGMISRGEVGLIVAGYGLGHGLIDQDVFSASVIIVLVTTMMTPPLLRLVFPAVERHHVAVEEAIARRPDDVHG